LAVRHGQTLWVFGRGLTGHNLDDAKTILRQDVFSKYGEHVLAPFAFTAADFLPGPLDHIV
jgi:hypothetical protein